MRTPLRHQTTSSTRSSRRGCPRRLTLRSEAWSSRRPCLKWMMSCTAEQDAGPPDLLHRQPESRPLQYRRQGPHGRRDREDLLGQIAGDRGHAHCVDAWPRNVAASHRDSMVDVIARVFWARELDIEHMPFASTHGLQTFVRLIHSRDGVAMPLMSTDRAYAVLYAERCASLCQECVSTLQAC